MLHEVAAITRCTLVCSGASRYSGKKHNISSNEFSGGPTKATLPKSPSGNVVLFTGENKGFRKFGGYGDAPVLRSTKTIPLTGDIIWLWK